MGEWRMQKMFPSLFNCVSVVSLFGCQHVCTTGMNIEESRLKPSDGCMETVCVPVHPGPRELSSGCALESPLFPPRRSFWRARARPRPQRCLFRFTSSDRVWWVHVRMCDASIECALSNETLSVWLWAGHERFSIRPQMCQGAQCHETEGGAQPRQRHPKAVQV